MAEFSLIDQLSAIIPTQGKGVALSIGDDAALLQPSVDNVLVAATDTLNEGVHFLSDTDPFAIGHKSLAVNLSDLAAMGAAPRWALLNLSLPDGDAAWVAEFARGFAALAESVGMTLVGGDTCAGARSVSVTVLGEVMPGAALRRDRAADGDSVFVSGLLGDAALALRQRLAGVTPPESLAARLDFPEPQLSLGADLRGIASACIDLSDGLAADLGHIARCSGLGAELELSALPASAPVRALPEKERWNLQLAGGEDYGLCFTVPRDRLEDISALANEKDYLLTCIGKMTEGEEVKLIAPGGGEFALPDGGWEHFSKEGKPDG